jgi:hypothetical protein
MVLLLTAFSDVSRVFSHTISPSALYGGNQREIMIELRLAPKL